MKSIITTMVLVCLVGWTSVDAQNVPCEEQGTQKQCSKNVGAGACRCNAGTAENPEWYFAGTLNGNDPNSALKCIAEAPYCQWIKIKSQSQAGEVAKVCADPGAQCDAEKCVRHDEIKEILVNPPGTTVQVIWTVTCTDK